MVKPIEIVILAAGVGSRMRSEKPKVLQTLGGVPLLHHLLETVHDLNPIKIHVVVGRHASEIKNQTDNRMEINWVIQEKPKGTGHALAQVVPHLLLESRLLVLLGDAPLVKRETMEALLSDKSDLVILTTKVSDPTGYGRIVREGGEFSEIVEEKDTSSSQKLINEINTGVMVINSKKVEAWVNKITDNNVQKEHLLTDMVKIANHEKATVSSLEVFDSSEVQGVNTFSQLANMERVLQKNKAERLMESGVQIMDPTRIDIRGTLKAGKGVVLDINCVFEGQVVLGDNVLIGPNCVVSDSKLDSGTVLKPNSVLEGADVGKNCSVGPFARLRPGAVLGDDVSVGNFVEVKKSVFGVGAKANHLAYVGDSEVGAGANIGAGTITCNYDGANKSKTKIGKNAFIGSNSSLVAPVSIGDEATVGAGSTITKDVKDGELAVGRSSQKNVAGWMRPKKKD